MSRPRLSVLVGTIAAALVAWVFAMGAWAAPQVEPAAEVGTLHQQAPATMGLSPGAAWLIGPGPAMLFVLGAAVSVWPVRRREPMAAGIGGGVEAPADRPETMAA